MQKVVFALETVTPLFIGGGDPKNIAYEGLRPPSLKGLLRWWFRALAGGNCGNNIALLKEKEEELFGSTSAKSKVILKTVFNEHYMGRKVKSVSSSLNWCRNQSISYLFWSVLRNRRPFIETGSKFKVELMSYDQEALKKAIACLWCLMYLGNVGSRSRRGAGGLAVLINKDVKEIEKLTGLEFVLDKSDSQKICNWIRSNFKKAVTLVTGGKNLRKSLIEHPIKIIVSKKGWDCWDEALAEIGSLYKNYRRTKLKDSVDIAVFGLPVIFRKQDGLPIYGEVDGKKVNRRASPIMFKVYKCKDKYYWGLIRYNGEFLPRNGRIRQGKRTYPVNLNVLDNFWSELVKEGYEISVIPT